MSLTDHRSKNEQASALRLVTRFSQTKGRNIIHTGSDRPGIGAIGYAVGTNGGSTMRPFVEAGFKPLEGYQIRYIYFLDPMWRSRLTVPEIPYSRIDELGIGMYKGKKRPPKQTGLDDQSITGGAEPTRPLQ